eukprot:gene4133-8211_t
MARIWLSLTLFAALFYANAQLPSVIGPQEVSTFRKLSSDILKGPSTLRDAYYATRILGALNLTELKCDCPTIIKMAQSAKDFDLYYGIAASKSCGCSVDPSSDARNSIKASLKSNDLRILAAGAMAAKAIGENYAGMKDVVGKIKSLMEPDGLFKPSTDATSSSVENTRIALEVLSQYSDSSTKFIVSEIVETVVKLLPTGDDDGIVDPLLLSSLTKLTGEKIRLSTAQVNTIGNSLLTLSLSHDLSTIASSMEGLSIIRTYATQPVFISLSKSSFNAKEPKSITIAITDVFDKSIVPTSIEIKSVKRTGISKESSIYSGKLDIIDDKATLDLSSLPLPPAVYSIRMSVLVTGRKAAITVEKFITITTSIDISAVWFGLTDSKQTHLSDLTPLTTQNSLSGFTAASVNQDFIHVAFTVTSSSTIQRPHQLFLKFTHIESNTHTFYVGQEEGQTSDGVGVKYRVTVSVADEIETFLYHSGEYSLAILVGDPVISAVQWNLGEIEMTLSSKPKKDYPLYAKSLLADSDNTLVALPEIVHRMRGPPKQASSFMSSVFTLAVISPLIIFLGFILSLKPNLNRLQSIWSVLFIICIIAALGLFAAYWLAVKGASFYDTIKYICLLVPVTFVVGRSALASVTNVRLAENKKE